MDFADVLKNRVLLNLTVLFLFLLAFITLTEWNRAQPFSRSVITFSNLSNSSLLPTQPNPPSVLSGIPHVDVCHTCKSCIVPQFPKSPIKRRSSRRLFSMALPQNVRLGHVFNKGQFPDCEVCWGCRHNLFKLPKNRTAFGLKNAFKVHRGMTESDVYQIQDPSIDQDKFYVVKLWGVNSDNTSISTKKTKDITQSIQLSLGIQRLVDECGLRDIVSNQWLAPVDGVIPKRGIRVKWDGLWSDYAHGISLKSFSDQALRAGMDPQKFEDFLNNKINSTEIKMAAILDLLSFQGDRHAKNIFVDETGHLTLIDMDQVWGHAWRYVFVDSLFLPRTQFHTAQHVGLTYLRKYSNESMEHILPSVVFDYRCHVSDGVIGKNYPPKIEEVLKKIANMSIEHVMEHYYLRDHSAGTMLLQRAKDLLEFGFEWTLENGKPKNPSSLIYPPHPPCCKIKVIPDSFLIKCDDPKYERHFFRPEGNSLNPPSIKEH